MKALKSKIIRDKSGEEQIAEIGMLGGKHEFSQTQDLHQLVVDSLGPDEKEFLLPKSESYFQKMFKGEAGYTIGVKINDQLVAKSVITLPKSGDLENGLEGIRTPVENDKIAVFESDVVHPDWRGLGLNKWMTAYREQVARDLGKTNVLSQIYYNNIANIHAHMKNGMQIIDAIYYPEDNAPIFYLNGNLYSVEENWDCGRHGISIISIDAGFDEFRELIDQGLIGINVEARNIIFCCQRQMAYQRSA